jgi:cytochrome c553
MIGAARTYLTAAVVAALAGTQAASTVMAQQQKSDRSPSVGMMMQWQAPREAARENDKLYVRGRAVAVGAADGGQSQANKAQACFSCHGLDGAGDPAGAFPRIAGQPAYYLYKQLVDYASETRPNAIMSPIAKTLSGEDMEAVAAYYSAQTDAPALRVPPADPLTIQHGGALSAIGSAEKGIQACVNCHGPGAVGLPPTVPYLAGQHPAYVRLELQEWKARTRRNDPLGVMADIARRMSEDDISAVAAYFAHLPAPGTKPGETSGTAAAK